MSGLGSLDLDESGGSPWDDVRPSQPTSTPAYENTEAQETDQNDPLAAETVHSPTETPATPVTTTKPTTTSAPAKSSISRTRAPRRAVNHVARFEAVEDDPLGPLGDNFDHGPEPASAGGRHDQPPEPPRKEVSPRSARVGPVSSGSGARRIGDMMESVHLDDDVDEDDIHQIGGRRAPRNPPPVALPGPTPQRSIPPSVPVEEAAKVSFDIAVGDPHKVGDLTSAHIVYSVRTKTTSKAYRQPEFSVTRRYSDFLWLYTALHSNNPGIIIPPPPEKQAVGRFDNNFVESRRAALERMLNRIASHPTLQQDADLKLFLESETFNVDIKHKEKNSNPLATESKGFFGNAFSGVGPKFIETDEWFHDRRSHLDLLETQLKGLVKALDTVVKQRRDLSESAADFSSSLHSLSGVELSPTLTSALESLSYLQMRIKELYERQAQQDILTIGIALDEYIRIISSAKLAFTQRQKAFNNWHVADSELNKKKSQQEKLMKQGKTQQDRLNQVAADVADSERKMHQSRLLFDDVGRLLRAELERFDKEKVEDFKSAVETYLESAVEAQKELIEIWETFLMQLDTEEEQARLNDPSNSANYDDDDDDTTTTTSQAESSVTRQPHYQQSPQQHDDTLDQQALGNGFGAGNPDSPDVAVNH